MNRLVEGNRTPTCRPGTTIRIVTSAEVVIVVVLKRAFECFILHYSALVVWLGFHTRNYGQINLLRKKMAKAYVYSVRENGKQGQFLPSYLFIFASISTVQEKDTVYVIKKDTNESR